MRPSGIIKLRMTFNALSRIDSSYRPTLEETFKRVAAKLKVWVGDFSYIGEIFEFTIQYEISVNITGVINSLKTVSSRAMNNFLDRPQQSRDDIDSKMVLNKRQAFWAHNYSYVSLGIKRHFSSRENE